NLPNEELGDKYSIDKKMLIEETKVECMLGMLLCLDREQRIVFILGGIFGVESKFGSEILEITESNFRKRLSRARGELKNYMTDNCSLLNPENSCKCTKKTKAAIEQGYVNPEKLQFSDEHMERVKERVERSDITVDDMKELRFQQLFREHPYKIFETSEFSEFMGGM
ncbi:MAG: RNA polymerase sigma factor, partial [bacterium]|nr:RNA polymerase sigma factor [bacterium]